MVCARRVNSVLAWTLSHASTRNVFWWLVGLTVFILFVHEELTTGCLYLRFANHYRDVVFRPITVQRPVNSTSIGIVVVLKDSSNEVEYRLARASLECYARYHNYSLNIVDISNEPLYNTICPQKDFMFRRHCAMAHIVETSSNTWSLFVDADTGVINPSHLLEDYVNNTEEHVHVIFYDRIFNYEVMAGSYFVRKSPEGLAFLRFWSDYEQRLPDSFHGTDNGAIQTVILEHAVPQRNASRLRCQELWNVSKDYDSLYRYEACIRWLLEAERDRLGPVKILSKSRRSWARDVWVTNSLWSARDFFLHGWKTGRRDKLGFGRWHQPLLDGSFSSSDCSGKETFKNWHYKDSFIASDVEVAVKMQKKIRESRAEYEKVVEDLIASGYLDLV